MLDFISLVADMRKYQKNEEIKDCHAILLELEKEVDRRLEDIKYIKESGYRCTFDIVSLEKKEAP